MKLLFCKPCALPETLRFVRSLRKAAALCLQVPQRYRFVSIPAPFYTSIVPLSFSFVGEPKGNQRTTNGKLKGNQKVALLFHGKNEQSQSNDNVSSVLLFTYSET
mgnify:CR=1 FL=1